MVASLEEIKEHYESGHFLVVAASLEEYALESKGNLQQEVIELGKKLAFKFAGQKHYDLAINLLYCLGLHNEVSRLETIRDYREAQHIGERAEELRQKLGQPQ